MHTCLNLLRKLRLGKAGNLSAREIDSGRTRVHAEEVIQLLKPGSPLAHKPSWALVPLLKLVLGWGTCRVSILHLANFYSSFITQLRGCLLQEAFPDHFPDRPYWAGCLLWVSTCPPVLCCGVACVLLGGCSLHLTRPFQDGDVWVGLPGGSPGQGTAWGRLEL